MKRNVNREMHICFALTALIALSVAMSGCGGSSTNTNSAATPDANRSAPSTTAPTPAPDPAQALFGEWETDNPDARTISGGTTPFVRWKINPGVKDTNGVYTGKLTDPDRSNLDLANYKIGPQNIISLEFINSTPPRSATYDYEVSSDGNTLTLKTGSNPIILKKGTANRDILKDADTIHNSGGRWEPTPNTATILNGKFSLKVDHIVFDKPIPSGEGYGGDMKFVDLSAPSPKMGKYIVTAKNSVILDIGAGRTPAKYTLEQNGDILKINLPDGTEWVLNRK